MTFKDVTLEPHESETLNLKQHKSTQPPLSCIFLAPKGFVSAVSNMRSFVPAIYDITVAIPKTSPPPTMLRLFKGKPSVVHVHIKCHSMKDLPESEEEIAVVQRSVRVAEVTQKLQTMETLDLAENYCSQVEGTGVGKFRNKRLVSFIGYCAEGNERLLVAEYMVNDTLSKYLFHWEISR
ncbi:unnamed protein product [Eruca vesicaria subsp. sativa]|uniref:Serine/threonine-protein kinase BSK n=1 Tax=Eruca vesicaria subsp. sativa TaxID=29727 RepID=A0ABC8LVY2_ERUVS|nr:unnamed protein product [Eruca vesicaria subsp. sativa]